MSKLEDAFGKLFDAIMIKKIHEKIQENESENKNNDLWIALIHEKMQERKDKDK